ncbi:MAG: T9SS type A sorting domain-containing protein, partial [Bacteroidales bacterium]|nr:T9SS type A sorting domain-containing protein [Bacteroidales bacterium]
SIINWERKKDNEDWTVISHTGVTYNDTPTSEGEYRYRVNVQLGTCQSKYSSEKIIEVLNSSSIDDISLDINLSIYPNPNNGSFRITSNEENTVNLQIINSLGQVVLNENTKIDNKEINIQGLNNGTYFLRILSNNKTVNKKLIINK